MAGSESVSRLAQLILLNWTFLAHLFLGVTWWILLKLLDYIFLLVFNFYIFTILASQIGG